MDEILKRSLLPIFLAHEEKRKIGGKEHDPCREFLCIKGDERAQSVPSHTVSHLIMILGENDKFGRRQVFGRASVSPSPIRRVLATVHKSLPQGLHELVEIAEILIIAIPIPRQKGTETVVKIVIPLGIQTIPPLFRRVNDPNIIEIALSDHINGTS
jgi:hypothetical protein